jgi:hypothetical protein
MSLRKLGIALIAVMALGASSAPNAFAIDEAVTDVSSWTVGGVNLAQNTPKAITCKRTAASENFKLETIVAEAPFELEATGVSCSEAAITNVTVAGVHMAVVTGKVTMSGVKVVKPSGTSCTVPEEMIKTNLLEGILQMGKAPRNKTEESFLEVKPDAAAGQTRIATAKVEGCSLEGSYPITGNFYTTMTLNTKEDAVVQEFNGNFTTCAMSFLKFGFNGGCFFGELAIEAGGAAWGATNG